MTQTALKPMTGDAFFHAYAGRGRAELVRGEVNERSPAGAEHGFYAMRLGSRLMIYVESHDLGVVCAAETGFYLARDPDTVRAPDAAFVAKERLPGGRPPVKFWPFAPNLAVEVVSPDDTAQEIEQKVGEYFAAGTRLVRVCYPKTRTVHVYRTAAEARILQAGDTLSGDDVIPGFTCPLAEVFA